MRRWGLYILGPLLATAWQAGAEGARVVWDCRVGTVCDHIGTCSSVDQTVRFEREPVDVGRFGEGTYRMRYRDVKAEATQVSPLTSEGLAWMIHWGHDEIFHQITSGGGERLVWLETPQFLSSEPTPPVRISFMHCEPGR